VTSLTPSRRGIRARFRAPALALALIGAVALAGCGRHRHVRSPRCRVDHAGSGGERRRDGGREHGLVWRRRGRDDQEPTSTGPTWSP